MVKLWIVCRDLVERTPLERINQDQPSSIQWEICQLSLDEALSHAHSYCNCQFVQVRRRKQKMHLPEIGKPFDQLRSVVLVELDIGKEHLKNG